jgi:hypothetical protein
MDVVESDSNKWLLVFVTMVMVIKHNWRVYQKKPDGIKY